MNLPWHKKCTNMSNIISIKHGETNGARGRCLVPSSFGIKRKLFLPTWLTRPFSTCIRPVREREQTFQQHLLQSGGGITEANVNASYHFDLNPLETKTTVRMGVWQCRFTTCLRQSGNFVEQSHLVGQIQQGLQRATDSPFQQEEIGDDDRLFFKIGSNSLSYNFGSWQLRGRDWWNNTPYIEQHLQHLANSLNSSERTIPLI